MLSPEKFDVKIERYLYAKALTLRKISLGKTVKPNWSSFELTGRSFSLTEWPPCAGHRGNCPHLLQISPLPLNPNHKSSRSLINSIDKENWNSAVASGMYSFFHWLWTEKDATKVLKFSVRFENVTHSTIPRFSIFICYKHIIEACKRWLISSRYETTFPIISADKKVTAVSRTLVKFLTCAKVSKWKII